MQKIAFPLVGGSYDLQDQVIDFQTCINFYPQEAEQGGGKSVLLPTPGLEVAYQFAAPCRGMFALSDREALAVMGQRLYKIGPETIDLGSVPGSLSVSMVSNGIHVLIVGVQVAIAYSIENDTVQTVTLPDGMQASHGAFLAGRFVVNQVGTGRFYWSDLYSVNFDPLAYATAESSPDRIIAILENDDHLWLFGEKSTEIWYATGDRDLPYLRMQGTNIQAGCIAPSSIAKVGTSVIWLAKTEMGSGQVVMAQAYQPQRISTHALEYQMSQYVGIDEATAYSYQHCGHGFYQLNFSDQGLSWCFDVRSGQWHQRASWNDGFIAHAARFHVMQGLRHLVSDSRTGALYWMADEYHTDAGAPIVRERVCPAIYADGALVRHLSLTLSARTGSARLGEREPVLALSWSDDNGKTWCDDRLMSLGAEADFAKRLIWRRLGSSRHRLYRVRYSEQPPITLMDGFLEVAQ